MICYYPQPSSWVWLLLLVHKHPIHALGGCIERERRGLLEFKAFLMLNNEDPDLLLPSWVDDESSNCCEWERVSCDPITGQVTGLFLNNTRQISSLKDSSAPRWLEYHANDKYWLLNASLFLPFGELRNLDLSANSFDGCIEFEELASLRDLEILDLRHNVLEGFRSSTQDLEAFSNLEILNLRLNCLTGSVPSSIRALSSLKVLSLSNNRFNSSLSIQGLCELKKLEELDLSLNSFEGILPPCLNNLTSLRLLDLSQNLLTGSISSSLIAIETEHSTWVPMFQLKVLIISNCNLNKLTGGIPKFLQYQYSLTVVDLSLNNLSGSFPNWLLENNRDLKFLNLRHNSFMGQIHLTCCPNIYLDWMDISDNLFNGQLQENIAQMIPQLSHLNLSKNGFEGNILSLIVQMSNLKELDVSGNDFSGEVPKQFVGGCHNLKVLKLSNNGFRGQIFSEYFNLTGLEFLHLDNNEFSGTLSDVITRSPLSLLDIRNNYMSGEMPNWIGNTTLRTLAMGNNSFKGQLPCEVVALKFFDISHNALSVLEHLHLQGNRFTGAIQEDFLNSLSLLTLDIRDNSLNGSIPKSIVALSNLRILLLEETIYGLIPNHLCQLTKISLMDLSNNSFSGSIPRCLGHFQFGETTTSDNVFAPSTQFGFGNGIHIYAGYLERYFYINGDIYDEQDEVEFVTKYRSGSYKGDILNFMSGLDLSCNNLTGEIPHELGNLSSLHALNLSHNELQGTIPKGFSNLSQIESLDLSYNRLSGEIPSELTQLNFLAVFTVVHNNFSGRVPDLKQQFGTFDETSYDGNPFLCGPLLKKNAALILSYHIHLWFNFIEDCIYLCYYFPLMPSTRY
ncbi:hypothetical protein AAG906_004810 [Vitis piasezkii]